jgi:MoaA/NifB/PqqE/SkfB family radical SAM enzyme
MTITIKKLVKAIIPYGILVGYRRLKKFFSEKCEHSFLFEVHVADHCNLNCAGCSHFSPLADEHFLDVRTYEKDCKRFSELTKGYIHTIRLMGGEPLLHDKITDIIKITRENFPDSIIKIVTNGILLDSQKAEFWDCCHSNDVVISITSYPVNLNVRKIFELSKEHDVNLENYSKGYRIKFKKEAYDLEGKQNKRESFLKCWESDCHHLRDGKLYICPIAAYIKYFNKFFSKNLEILPEDYLDIYQARNIKEVLSYLNKPIPFCRYCKFGPDEYTIDWHISKKEISEWT